MRRYRSETTVSGGCEVIFQFPRPGAVTNGRRGTRIGAGRSAIVQILLRSSGQPLADGAKETDTLDTSRRGRRHRRNASLLRTVDGHENHGTFIICHDRFEHSMRFELNLVPYKQFSWFISAGLREILKCFSCLRTVYIGAANVRRQADADSLREETRERSNAEYRVGGGDFLPLRSVSNRCFFNEHRFESFGSCFVRNISMGSFNWRVKLPLCIFHLKIQKYNTVAYICFFIWETNNECKGTRIRQGKASSI